MTSAVKILGREYRLRGDVEDGHLDQVVAYLDQVLQHVQRNTPDTQDAAILAALNVASELIRMREVPQADGDRLRALVELVESA